MTIHRTNIASLFDVNMDFNEKDSIRISGWVRTKRNSKAGLSFVSVYDGSCFDAIQVIADHILPNYQTDILRLTSGCCVEVIGILVPSPAKGQRCEIQAKQITVLGWVDNPETYPMQPKPHSMEHLREHAHLRPRTNMTGAISRLRQTVSHAIHQFFDQEGFLWVNTPLITASDCEGAGEMFQVSTLDLKNIPLTEKNNINYQADFFSKPAFLTVSGQLNAETYAQALTKIYTFGPTFRAENSNTSRHLAEFWMIEPEVAFADLSDIALLSETLLKTVCKAVLDRRLDDLTFFNERIDKTCLLRLEKLINTPFIQMEYTEAIAILEKANRSFENPVSWGIDLSSEHERFLTEEYINGPLIIKNYPKAIKSFYMRDNPDGKTVAAMDVLAPGIGEIIGGSQREERYDYLKQKMLQKGMDLDTYHWYLDLRRYGTCIHSGFGLGLERLLSYISGLSNVRDITPFPRVPRYIEF
ncbi:MAG: asparagine--tRNA ligase [Endozoicomonadaceae bacterium]|nr:asparagine--tRNA ligase [Endozoicomonadaceae bacterium]